VTTPPAEAPATPTSAASVAEWLLKEHGDTATEEKLAPTVAAVNRFVRRVHNPDPSGAWAEDHALGATMLAARLWRRRRSVEGVLAEFTAAGPAYVSRHDPDVAMLLQLGPYAVPTVG
jgi:hypothetical protein